MNKYIITLAMSGVVIAIASWKIKTQVDLIVKEVRTHTSVMGLVEKQLEEDS